MPTHKSLEFSGNDLPRSNGSNRMAGLAFRWTAGSGSRVGGTGGLRKARSTLSGWFSISGYGSSRLRFPLFGEGGVGEFETLMLRAGCNNTWLHWSGEERRRGDYIRDQWMRDTLRAMGHVSARGIFVHLYLDGLYWGLYNLTERPGAFFAAAHFGGAPKDYDSRNGNHILEGTDAAWQILMRLANAGVTNRQAYDAIAEMVNIPEFIDYMLVNLYGGECGLGRRLQLVCGPPPQAPRQVPVLHLGRRAHAGNRSQTTSSTTTTT